MASRDTLLAMKKIKPSPALRSQWHGYLRAEEMRALVAAGAYMNDHGRRTLETQEAQAAQGKVYSVWHYFTPTGRLKAMLAPRARSSHDKVVHG